MGWGWAVRPIHFHVCNNFHLVLACELLVVVMEVLVLVLACELLVVAIEAMDGVSLDDVGLRCSTVLLWPWPLAGHNAPKCTVCG